MHFNCLIVYNYVLFAVTSVMSISIWNFSHYFKCHLVIVQSTVRLILTLISIFLQAHWLLVDSQATFTILAAYYF